MTTATSTSAGTGATTSTATATGTAVGGDVDAVPRVVVPADIDTPDRIAWGLSFRQLAVLAAGIVPLWLAYTRLGPALPDPAWVAIAVLVVAVTVTVALGRRDGLPLDAWVRHGLTHRARPRLLTPGTPGTSSNGSDAGRPLLVTDPVRPVVPAPLRSPATTITGDGTVTVDDTPRAVLACGTTNIALRTGAEQAGLLDGFAGWLNSLTGPTQILVSAARHDLTPLAEATADAAHRLPNPALRAAAADHALFLAALDADREPLHRQVLLVVPAGHPAQTATRALTALGVTTVALDGPAVTAALTAAVDPYTPPVPGPRAVPGTPITGTPLTAAPTSVGTVRRPTS